MAEKLTAEQAQEAAEERCAEQGHSYENCCSMFFQVYQRCKWCGHEIPAGAIG